jgi:hypothetical protein
MDRIPYVPQLHHGDDLPAIDCDDYQNDLIALMNSEQPASAQEPQ